MSESGTYEVMHNGKVHRAASMEVVLRWARERRINGDDSFREAGEDQWIPVSENSELAAILDPASWWTVRTGEKEYTAPDFETVVEWTREGRLSTDTVIEGPRTPPGGVLANGLPGLAPFLRDPVVFEPGEEPPRLRVDGRNYLPGDLDSIREWIRNSRVPLDAEISLDGGAWEPVSECGLFELELWPAGAHGEHIDEDGQTGDDGESDHAGLEGESASAEGRLTEASSDDDSGPEASEFKGEPFVIATLAGEYEISEPSEIFVYLDRKKVHTFDEIRHPDLPDGACSVAKMIEILNLRRRKSFWWVWICVILLVAAACIYFKPFGLFQ